MSRGCPFECEFCDVPSLIGRKMRYKSPSRVCAELDALRSQLPRGHVFICDDNLTGSPVRAREVLEAVAAWQRRNDYPFVFSTQLSVNVSGDASMLDLLYEANVRNVFCGIESANEESLLEAGKHQNLRASIEESVTAFLRAGIEVNAYLVLGFDNDPPDIARRQLRLIQRSGVTLAEVNVLVAMDNTPLSQRMAREGRLLYGTASSADLVLSRHAVGLSNFITKMENRRLQENYLELVEGLYDPCNWYERTRRMVEQLPDRDREHHGMPMRWSATSLLIGLLTVLLMPARRRLIREAASLLRRTGQGWRVWRYLYAVFGTGVSINGYRAATRRVRSHLARASESLPVGDAIRTPAIPTPPE